MFGSGCRLGEEYKLAWEELQQEARQCANWLGKELEEDWWNLQLERGRAASLEVQGRLLLNNLMD